MKGYFHVTNDETVQLTAGSMSQAGNSLNERMMHPCATNFLTDLQACSMIGKSVISSIWELAGKDLEHPVNNLIQKQLKKIRRYFENGRELNFLNLPFCYKMVMKIKTTNKSFTHYITHP